MTKIPVSMCLDPVRLDARIKHLLELDREKRSRDDKKEEEKEVKTSKEKKHPKKP